MQSSSSRFSAYSLASIVCLAIGSLGFLIGLLNSTTLALSEQGYYLTLLAFGLYAAISIQKNERDAQEGLKVSKAYSMISYFAGFLATGLLAVGLVNANLALSEKGFYGISFLMALFCAVTVQKNLRDENKVGDILNNNLTDNN